MNEVKQKLFEIIQVYTRDKTVEDIAAANTLADLDLDSVAMMGILADVEEDLHIHLDDVPTLELTIPEFVKVVEEKVAAKDAAA